MTTIYRKCPFCSETQFGVEKWNTNLYLLKCLNKNTSASNWAALNKHGRFQFVDVHFPKSNTTSMEEYKNWKRRLLDDNFWEQSIKTRRTRVGKDGSTVQTFINKRGEEEVIPEVPMQIRSQRGYGHTRR